MKQQTRTARALREGVKNVFLLRNPFLLEINVSGIAWGEGGLLGCEVHSMVTMLGLEMANVKQADKSA